MAAIIVAGVYFKRGVQGRWRAAVDDLGEQYDPKYTNTDITYSLSSRTDTVVYTEGDGSTNPIYTFRRDNTNQTETTTGFRRIGAAP